jgi:hypothetical protein
MNKALIAIIAVASLFMPPSQRGVTVADLAWLEIQLASEAPKPGESDRISHLREEMKKGLEPLQLEPRPEDLPDEGPVIEMIHLPAYQRL